LWLGHATSATYALAVLLAVCLLTAACGEQKSADPFMGTWSMDSGEKPRWVITRDDGEYTIFQGFPGAQRYSINRHWKRIGDRILRWEARTNPDNYWELLLDSEGQVLLLESPNLLEPSRVTLTRVSDSTETPVPVP
jgi:hypothetical protein